MFAILVQYWVDSDVTCEMIIGDSSGRMFEKNDDAQHLMYILENVFKSKMEANENEAIAPATCKVTMSIVTMHNCLEVMGNNI